MKFQGSPLKNNFTMPYPSHLHSYNTSRDTSFLSRACHSHVVKRKLKHIQTKVMRSWVACKTKVHPRVRIL